jgi:hypothetical protein
MGDRLEPVPCLAQERVEYKQESQVWKVRSEAAVLQIGIILQQSLVFDLYHHPSIFTLITQVEGAYDLSARDPTVDQQHLILLIARVGSFSMYQHLCSPYVIWHGGDSIRLDTVYGIHSIRGTHMRKTR